jgi:ABC-type molybdate transport system substrate-binding protein
MSREPIQTKITEIRLPQSKTKKDGSFLRQTLDDSHVAKQTPAKVPYGSTAKMARSNLSACYSSGLVRKADRLTSAR